MTRVSTRRAMSATARIRVEDECVRRDVDCEIEDHGPWMLVRMSGQASDVAAAWAAIRQGRLEGVH